MVTASRRCVCAAADNNGQIELVVLRTEPKEHEEVVEDQSAGLEETETRSWSNGSVVGWLGRTHEAKCGREGAEELLSSQRAFQRAHALRRGVKV